MSKGKWWKTDLPKLYIAKEDDRGGRQEGGGGQGWQGGGRGGGRGQRWQGGGRGGGRDFIIIINW